MWKIPNNFPLNLVAFLAGCLTVFGFAPFYLYPIPIITITVFLLVHEKCNQHKSTVLLGLFFGFGLFISGTSWIFISLTRYGGMNVLLAGTLIIVFSIYLSVYTSIMSSIMFHLRKLTARVRFLLVFPAMWTLAELGRGYFFTGFPWLTIGYSQVPESPLIGYAPILGVYGISFISVFLAGAISLTIKNSIALGIINSLKTNFIPIFLCLAIGQCLTFVNWARPIDSPPTRIALIQGNISQDVKWNPEVTLATIDHYLNLTEKTTADLVLLPETAFPIFDKNIPLDLLNKFTEPAKKRGATILVGVPELSSDGKYYNSVISLGKSDKQIYRKIHLVPFGDYLPLKSLFGWFMESANIPMSSFSRGNREQTTINASGQKIGVNICYEDVFGEEIIRLLPEATILANFTNDAWWGKSIASQQHLQISQMRAIETSRFMLRATNTGVTAIIKWDGRIDKLAPQFETKIIEATVTAREGTTPFVILGNKTVFIISIIIIGIGIRIQAKSVK